MKTHLGNPIPVRPGITRLWEGRGVFLEIAEEPQLELSPWLADMGTRATGLQLLTLEENAPLWAKRLPGAEVLTVPGRDFRTPEFQEWFRERFLQLESDWCWNLNGDDPLAAALLARFHCSWRAGKPEAPGVNFGISGAEKGTAMMRSIFRTFGWPEVQEESAQISA